MLVKIPGTTRARYVCSYFDIGCELFFECDEARMLDWAYEGKVQS